MRILAFALLCCTLAACNNNGVSAALTSTARNDDPGIAGTVAAATADSSTDEAAAEPSAGPKFRPPVKVTPTNGYGYEPTVVVDDYGNIFGTAHKENWQLALAPDENSPLATRSMSWAWMSIDGGESFINTPGMTELAVETRQVGDEGDMALDDAGHLYYVDTWVADVTLTRYSIKGKGAVALDYSRLTIPALQPMDDRPWIEAKGDGIVFYFGNEGDKTTYTLGRGAGSGFGPGRYTMYKSYDGGYNWDSFGYTLADSGWCRPAADHAPGSPYLYVICGNDSTMLYSYVSDDNGQTFERYDVAEYNGADPTASYPTVEVAPDGSIWFVYVDTNPPFGGGMPTANTIRLFHSIDHGETWTEQDATPMPGRYQYAWLSVSKSGKLGMGVYYRPDAQSDWRVYATIWNPGEKPVLTSLDEDNPVSDASYDEPPGDYLGAYFGPENELHVIWTRRVLAAPADATTLARDIYHARSE